MPTAVVTWDVEQVVHFEPGSLSRSGQVHFGFHDREGRHYLVEHQRHFIGLLDAGGRLVWTVARERVREDVPNIAADVEFPMYVDRLARGPVLVSNFRSARIYRVDVEARRAELFVDGHALGMEDAGNCVVDDQDHVWVNEVQGCRVWEFDASGRVVGTLGDGTPGFQREGVPFSEARFHWIYDLRRGPEGNLYVLDSRNFAVRRIDVQRRRVETIAGTGKPGYDGDGGPATAATFGSDPGARFDGPISLSLDEEGNYFIGDRFNRVVRMVDARTGIVTTIAGHHPSTSEEPNDPTERNPLRLRLPKISSMDYHDGRLLVPTDLSEGSGDLVVLRKHA